MLVLQQGIRSLLIIIGTLMLFGCSQATREPLRIAINPWPGFEMLYVIKEKGFFEQVGLNVELIPAGSLADSQRAYLRGTVDGLTSTLVEVIQIQSFKTRPLRLALLTDYSLGGDIIVARKDIDSVAALKNQQVGAEVSSLGIYVLARALEMNALSLADVVVINTEQNAAESALRTSTIAAYVTYPPVSLQLLAQEEYHALFDSQQLPKEIIDNVAISEHYLSRFPDTIAKLHEAWQLGLDELAQNPEDAIAIMAPKEGLSPTQFTEALKNLTFLTKAQQQQFLQSNELQTVINRVCATLIAINSIEGSCQHLESLLPALNKSI